MVSARLHYLPLLLIVLILGGSVHFIIFFKHNLTPKVQDVCSNTMEWCESVETARTCNVVDLCKMQWKSNDIENKTVSVGHKAKPVAVEVYFESLCPDSEQFIIDQLYPSYKKLLGKGIFSIELIPYGNAKESKKGDQWMFSCQHGEDECLGNMIEICAIHELKNVSLRMPFIFCMAKNKATLNTAKQCCKDLHVNFDPIDKCRTGKIGNELEHKMALKTQSLKPKHTFIPWITINGESEGLQTKALYNLLKLICDTYQGMKPDVCEK